MCCMKYLRLSFAVLFLGWTINTQADPTFTFTHIGGGETGSLTKNSEGSYTFVGGGNDIWDVSDEFDFAHVQVTGDFDVAVRVESLEPVARWTKAGIMVREQLTGDSRKAWNRVTPPDVATGSGGNGANDTRFSYRTGKTGGAGPNDGQHEEGTGAPEYPNGWLRLQREGSVVTAYASTDGVNWRQQGSQDTATWAGNVALPQTVYLGLAVSRHSGPDGLATCEFRDLQAVRIGSNPQNVTVPEGSAASFKVGLQGWGDWRVQWLENGVEIAGATERTYRIAATAPANNGKRYSARATDLVSGQVLTSTEATLTVISDTFAPTLVSAATPITPTPIGTQFDLVYSEVVNEADAENLANYAISGGATLNGAELQADGKTVRFATSDLYASGCKVLTVNNVRDRAPTPNTIAAGSQIAVITAKGNIRYHQYNGIGGTDIPSLTSNPKFPNFPDVVAYSSLFENPGGGGEHANDYGAQIVGYIHPPVSGDYRFYIAADDNAVLYLSTDDNPANKVAIAREPQWAGFREWTGNAGGRRACPGGNCENISAPVTLQAGCKYYAEFLFKEGGGGDYGSVTWRLPGAGVPANGALPITGAFLSPYDLAATISDGPNDITVEEGRIVSFSARIEGSPSLAIQWYRNGAPIEGATGTSITLGPLVYPDDNGATIHVVAQNSLGTATSRTATLTVLDDVTPPTIVSASASSSFNQIQIQFSEIMDAVTVVDTFAYEISDASGAFLTVSSITATPDGTGILIVLEGVMAEDTVHTIKVVGAVLDYAQNAMAPETTTTVRSFVSGCGGLLFEAYHNIGGNAVANLTADPDFPNNPNDRMVIGPVDSRAAYPDDSHENYGGRMSGVFVPPYSGNWVLYLRSDDGSELWFNPTGPSAAGKVRVAMEPGCCRAFEAIPTAAMPLTGGQPYYLEVLYKEGGGGDYAQVAARVAGSSEALAPITARDTGAFALGGAGGTLTITQQPANTQADEGQSATLSVATENTHGLRVCYQWQRDGVDIEGATGASYTFLPALEDDGVTYSVRASIPGHTVQSAAATLDVVPDTTAPTVVSVAGADTLRNVVIQFNERINANDAADTFLYEVRDGGGTLLTVSAAELTGDGMGVRLTTDPQTSGAVYTVTVGPVRDRSGAENTVAPPDNTGSFTAFTFSPGLLVFESWLNIGGNAVSLLTGDARFPYNPTETHYATAFDSRTVYADDSHESYGARMHGVFVPPVSGNWIFYLRSDDASELWLNPTGSDPAGKVKIQEELACCTAFSAHASTPQALVAGQAYYIEGLYKEGVGGDYIQVAAKLETDSTAPNSLRPISSGSLGIFANPVGASVQITQQPADSQTVCLNPLSGAGQSQALVNENFNSGNGGLTVDTPQAFNAPWAHNAAAGSWQVVQDGAEVGHPMTTRLSTPTFTVSRAGVVRLTFEHRYSFEPDFWDGGQVRVSVNGGAYAAVGGAAFSSGGYNGAVRAGSASAIQGQPAYVLDSPNHAGPGYVTSVADLGFLYPGDTVSVQFLYAGDTNTRGNLIPNWEINSYNLSEGNPGQASARFTIAATVSPGPRAIQWQRNSGSGWNDIPGATGTSYTFTPTLADNGARFRANVYTPGASATSIESVLTVIQANTAPSFSLSASTVTGTEDSGPASLSGLATGIQPHSIARVPVRLRTDFASAAGVAVRGQAVVQDGILKLINAGVGSQYGAASGDFALQTYESLDVTWKNRIGGGNGADGMSLSIGDDIPVDPGYGGEEGIGTGLIVAIDTFDNGAALDPCQTGLEMKWRGDVVACKTLPKDNDGTGNYLRKDAFVDAHLTVSAAGLATFTYDGNEISANLTSFSGLRANRALFWARTGGAHDNHWVDDFDLQLFPFDTSSVEAGQQVTFNTSNNRPELFSAQPAVSPDGTLSFTPAANACGQATVSLSASDNGGTICEGRDTSAAQSFVISIACVNDAPRANNQTVNTTTEQPTPITLSGTDVDEGDVLSFAVASNPSHGVLSTDASGNLIYTSNPGYSGPDSFTFTASDGALSSDPATVSINVVFNSRPVCVARTAPEGCSLSIGNNGKTYMVSVNGQNACIVLDGSGSTDAEGDALQISWVIDGTNTVSGAQVPVCLDLGCHTVDMIATDGKIACRQSLELCVITPSEGIDQIVTLVESTNVGRKNKQPLIATLKAAAASYDREGHIHTAANQLNAFQNKCRAQIGQSNPAEAQQFINAAAGLVEAIACSIELSAEE